MAKEWHGVDRIFDSLLEEDKAEILREANIVVIARRRQAQEALSAGWRSVYRHAPTQQAARDEGSRGAFVSEWHLDAPHRVPRAGLLD